MENKLKTRCYYTEYVNHMVRFYISCPDSLKTEGKRRSDIENWVAVQSVFHGLSEANRVRITEIYRTNFNLNKAVEAYCQTHGENVDNVWRFLTKVLALIARRRGLV